MLQAPFKLLAPQTLYFGRVQSSKPLVALNNAALYTQFPDTPLVPIASGIASLMTHSGTLSLLGLARQVRDNATFQTASLAKTGAVSQGGALIPAALKPHAYTLTSANLQSFDTWDKEVTLYTSLSPFKIGGLVKTLQEQDSTFPTFPNPPDLDLSFTNPSPNTPVTAYSKQSLEAVTKTWDWFFGLNPERQTRVLQASPWCTNPHTAWHHMTYTQGHERIFPNPGWLGVTRLPFFAIRLPRPLISTLYDQQKNTANKVQALDNYDYWGVTAIGNNQPVSARYVMRGYLTGQKLKAFYPANPNWDVTSLFSDPQGLPTSGKSSQVDDAIGNMRPAVQSSNTIKPLLTPEQLGQAVAGQSLDLNQLPQGLAASDKEAIHQAMMDFDWLTMRDFWFVSGDTLHRNGLEQASKPLPHWYIDLTTRNTQGLAANHARFIEQARFPWPTLTVSSTDAELLSGNKIDTAAIIMPDLLNAHGYNLLGAANPEFMYMGNFDESTLNQFRSDQSNYLRKIAYILQIDAALWRHETLAEAAQQSIEQLKQDRVLKSLFVFNNHPSPEEPGLIQTFIASDPVSKQQVRLPLTFLQFVPHGSEINNQFHPS